MRVFASMLLILTVYVSASAQEARRVASANTTTHAKTAAARLALAKASAEDESRKSAARDDAVGQLLDRVDEAEGGLARLRLRSRIIRGRVEMSGSPLSGTYELYEKVPGKKLEVINAPSGQFLHAADGAHQWAKSPFDLPVSLPESERQSQEADASGARQAKWKRYFTSASIRGKAFVDGREMVVLEAMPRDMQKTVIMYFDAQTWLLRKQEFVGHKPDDENWLKAVYIDAYAEVDGVKLPSIFRRVYEQYTLTFRIYEIKHNVPIDDALFRDPNGK